MLTATLLGASGFGTVVVGPLKQASEDFRVSQTSFEMYELPPFFSHHSDPALHVINSTLVLHDFRTLIIASTNSGPVPSPFIIAAFLLLKSTQKMFDYIHIYLFSYFGIKSILPKKELENGGNSLLLTILVNSPLSE